MEYKYIYINGEKTYFRIYSGVLKAGSYVLNATKDSKERIGRLLRMHEL